MERILLYFACILSGFALIKVPLAGTFLSSLSTTIQLIGVIAVIVFSAVLLYLGVRSLLNR